MTSAWSRFAQLKADPVADIVVTPPVSSEVDPADQTCQRRHPRSHFAAAPVDFIGKLIQIVSPIAESIADLLLPSPCRLDVAPPLVPTVRIVLPLGGLQPAIGPVVLVISLAGVGIDRADPGVAGLVEIDPIVALDLVKESALIRAKSSPSGLMRAP